MTVLSPVELNEIMDTVWGAVLNNSIDPDPHGQIGHSDCLCASIEIEGAWQGAILVKSTEECLTNAAALIFTKPPITVNHDDRVETLAELTNMIGGTVKSLLPDICNLSMPELLSADTIASLPTSVDNSWSYFVCEGHSVAVAVVEQPLTISKVA